ncbi:hypothetical protein NDU88_006858, partial [Pleurodeles waltl]
FLLISKPKLPAIYGVPKTHKQVQDPPLRPIMSTIGSATEPLSKYIHSFLKPLIIDFPSCVKDTGHMISQIEGLFFNPESSFLVTLDVEALYTNIPQQEAYEAVRKLLTDT